MKIILTGTEQEQNRNYDKLFAALQSDSILPRHMMTSEDEYQDGARYIVELKSNSQAVMEWAEQTSGVEVV